MTVNHMHIFIKVYQLENITKAAEILHMTQPAVSRAIKELETEYDVCLFERINRRLCRTECAHQLYAQAIHIADSFENMEEHLKSWGRHGTLRIGATITFGNYLIPDLVARFKACHPDTKIKVRIANGLQLQTALLENEIDIAMIEGGVSNETLKTAAFIQDRLRLLVPLDHPLTRRKSVALDDLVDYDLLTREHGSAVRTLVDHGFRAHGLHCVPAWESVSTHALIRGVELGQGVALLPERMVQTALQQGQVVQVPLQEPLFVRKSFLVWHKHKYLTKALQDFLADCRTYAEKEETL